MRDITQMTTAEREVLKGRCLKEMEMLYEMYNEGSMLRSEFNSKYRPLLNKVMEIDNMEETEAIAGKDLFNQP